MVPASCLSNDRAIRLLLLLIASAPSYYVLILERTDDCSLNVCNTITHVTLVIRKPLQFWRDPGNFQCQKHNNVRVFQKEILCA
jgi:hypothetical protein